MVCLSSVTRLRLCYLLFATYIILDVSVSLTTVIGLTTGDFGSQTNISNPDQTLKKTNKTVPFEDWASPNEKYLYESTKITERGDILKKAVRKSTKNESDIEQNREGWKGRVTYVEKVSHLYVPSSMDLMDEQELECPFPECDRSFKYQGALDKHILKHEQVNFLMLII